MLIRRSNYVVLMDQAGDAGAGVGAGGGAAATSGDAGAAGVDAGAAAAGGDKGAGAAAGAAGEGTLLSAAAGAGKDGAAAAGAAAVVADPLATIPEKLRVLGTDGKLDVSATLAKVNQVYGQLEKRMGEGGAPPEAADGYKTDAVVAKLKEANGGKDIELPGEFTKEFNAFALKAKLTQGQYDEALTGLMTMVPNLYEEGYQHAMKSGREQLAKVWGADGVKPDSPRMQNAVKAFNRFVPQALRNSETMDAIGNHPVVMQILEAIGAELKEDKSIGGESAGVTSELDTLYSSPAYWNKADPTHDWTVQRVSELMKGGAKPKVTRARQAVKL